MKKLILLIVLFSGLFLKSQMLLSGVQFYDQPIFGISTAYQNQSGNFGKLGGFMMFETKKKAIYKFAITANMASMKDQFIIIPELAGTYYFHNDFLMYFAKAEITPYTFTPKVGFSIGTEIDFGFGYGFSIHEKNNFKPIKGFTFSLNYDFPIE